jgi:hypothetical protein
MPLHVLCVFNYIMHYFVSLDSIMLRYFISSAQIEINIMNNINERTILELMEDAINDQCLESQVYENTMPHGRCSK